KELGVADEWARLSDLRFQFHIRSNTRFSDGEPILSSDVVFSMERIAQLQKLPIRCREVEDRVVEVDLTEPMPNFVNLLSTPPFGIVPKRFVGRYGFGAEGLVSSGPYRLEMLRVGPERIFVCLTKNRYYWDTANVKLPRAVYIPVRDPDERLKVFRTRHSSSGERLHYFLHHGPALRYRELRDDPEFHPTPVLGTILLVPNVRKWPFNHPQGRRALSYALDRNQIMQDIVPYLTVANGLIPEEIVGAVSPGRQALKPNLEHAKQLLAECGFPNGSGFPPTTLTIHGHVYKDLIAKALSRQWKESLGIAVQVVQASWNQYLACVQDGHFDLLYETWHSDICDPSVFIMPLTSDHPSNHAGYSREKFDVAVEREANKCPTDPLAPEILSAWLHAERLVLDDMPVIPLWFETHLSMVDAGVKGAHLNRVGILPLKNIELQ
ncbi:MAG: ABC transporter substrate-binding protein, partial [Firmicutes bacterium]|nr:ABC transporter substrate-binding protein [Bacillota bacterium]